MTKFSKKAGTLIYNSSIGDFLKSQVYHLSVLNSAVTFEKLDLALLSTI